MALNKRNVNSGTFKKGCVPWIKGKTHSAKTRKKLSTAMKKKIGEKNSFYGRHHTDEWKKRMSEVRKKIPYIMTKKRKKMFESKKGVPRLNFRGENNPRWVGEDSYSKKRHRAMVQSEYKKWRAAIFARDNFTCQDCGATCCKIHAHHKKPWRSHPTLRYKIDNGITFCLSCHAKNDKYYARFYKFYKEE